MTDKQNNVMNIENLSVKVGDKNILKSLNLTVKSGEIHALMGPNGAGKSTLAQAIIGNPKYTVTTGKILINGKDITDLQLYERAREGIFLAFQEPVSVQGLKYINFLRTAYMSLHPNEKLEYKKFIEQVQELLGLFRLDKSFIDRSLNDGLSGGEKKRMEALQMLLFKPKFVILDEIDSGLDVDALKIVAEAVKKAKESGTGILIITHYKRILDYVSPDFIHVLVDGTIVESGKAEIARKIEEYGYDYYRRGEVNAKVG